MPDKRDTQQQDRFSRTGMVPRPTFEPEQRQESKRPTTLPEQPPDAATTGTVPIISEGRDERAERDSDSDAVTGS